jgi:glucose-6-phosphate dehydrogenase assembly protein OpcA
VATAVTVASWEGESVRVGQVSSELALLQRTCAGRVPRTSVMTLVAVAVDDVSAAEAIHAMQAVVANHPARVLVLRPDPDATAALDARVELFRVEAAGTPIPVDDNDTAACFEQITLAVGGQAARHLDSLVEPLLQGDLPVVAWFADRVPDVPTDRLVSVAGTVVIDTRSADDPASLRALSDLGRRRPVVDLCWIRLEPVRNLIASLFDPPELRAFAGGVVSARVTGKPGPRYLLAGWLARQLGLGRRQVELVDSRHVAVRLEAVHAGQRAAFEVGRLAERRGLWAGIQPLDGWDGQPDATVRHAVELPDTSLTTTLAAALARMNTEDPVWAKAVSSASTLAS